MVNSTTIDDLRGETCIYKFVSPFSASEFLSCGTNMRGGVGEVLGDELTALWEADGAIKKREERRGDEWASGWIWVTSRVDTRCSFAQPTSNCLIHSDRWMLRELASAI